MNYYPIYLNLKGRRVLLVGAGSVAWQKVPGLLTAGARVHVVAPEALPDIQRLARDGKIKWSRRSYKKADTRDASLVIAATDDSALQKQIVKDAHARKVWVNIVDVTPLCDFIAPAIVRRGDIQMAISTGGAAPAIAKYLRQKLETLVGPEHEMLVKLMKKMRPTLLKLPKEKRLAVWKKIATDAFMKDIRRAGISAAQTRIQGWIRER